MAAETQKLLSHLLRLTDQATCRESAKALCAVFVLATAGLGAGLPFLRAPEPPPAAAVAPAAPAKDEPRRDLHGDYLAPGAVARLGTLRFRVPGDILSLAFAPDGKTIAVSTLSGVFLLEADSGKRIQSMPTADLGGHSADLLIFSEDSKRLAGRRFIPDNERGKGMVRVWDLSGARKRQDFEAENVVWLGWANGAPLAICLEKSGLRVLELAVGRSRFLLCTDLIPPYSYKHIPCVCAPAGGVLGVVGEQGLHVWDIASGRKRCLIRPTGKPLSPYFHSHNGTRHSPLAVSPDGNKLAALTPLGLQVWDATTGKLLYKVASKEYLDCQFSADSKLLAVLTEGLRTICFLDAVTGRERGRTRGTNHFFAFIFSLSSDCKTLATSEKDSGTIHLFDVITGEQRLEWVGHWREPSGIAFSPDGRRVATACDSDGTIHSWDLATGASRLTIRRPREVVRDLAFSQDGRSLFSCWTDDHLLVCDADTGQRQHAIRLDDPDRPGNGQSVLAMRLSDDGKRLIFKSYSYPKKNPSQDTRDILLTGIDARTRKPLFRRLRPRDALTAISLDGRVLAATVRPSAQNEFAGNLGLIQLEDVVTGDPILRFSSGAAQTWPLAFAPDARLLAGVIYRSGTPADKNALALWETATGSELMTWPLGELRVAFSADSRMLALAGPKQTIVVWDLARGRVHRHFKGFGADVTYLAFAPKGQRLVSGLNDSTLLVWDLGQHEDPALPKLGAGEVATAWADLAGADAARAFRARWALVSSPDEALALLQNHLRPVREADAQKLRRLLTDLGNAQFAVRSKAQAELELVGDLAEPALRQALANNPTLELRQRVQRALERLRGPVTRPEVLRPLRALAVLEEIGAPPARKLLETLASGAPASRLTREAQASLDRRNRRLPRLPE